MSRRIFLEETPDRNPKLFKTVLPKNVRPGDIFHGRQYKSKWYENTEGQKAVEPDRKYWRRKPTKAPVMVTKGPILPKKKEERPERPTRHDKPRAVPVTQPRAAKAAPVKKVPPPVAAGSVSKDAKGNLAIVIKAPTIAKLRGAKKRVNLLEGK